MYFRMEETVRAMLVYKKQAEQLRQEKAALTLAFEVIIIKFLFVRFEFVFSVCSYFCVYIIKFRFRRLLRKYKYWIFYLQLKG